MYRPLLLLFFLSCLTSGQRYAERNVLPAPSSYDDKDYEDYAEDEDGDSYGFREDEEPKVYKWNAEQFPHPMNTPWFCNRLKPSHVCDPDSVLEREQADLLDESIRKLYQETPCICDACDNEEEGGIVVGIALLKNLHHPYHMHHAKVIRSFAETLRVRWKLGRCDNDILIVVATTDRLSYTDVGSAASGHLSAKEAHRIFLENRAQFSASNFSGGLADILAGYHRATRAMRMRRMGRGLSDVVNVPLVAGAIVGGFLLLGLVIFVGIVVYRKRGRWCGADTKASVWVTTDDRGPVMTTVSSSWTKKDIKVLFGPEKSATRSEYQQCGTEDDDSFDRTEVTSDSEALDRELTAAADGLAETFPSRNVLVTDM